jgi:pseudouridine synthase
MTERLHKVLAHAGVASRRAAERLIREHRVRVNGATVSELGTQVDPARDRIEVDGQPLAHQATARHYILLNKPLGVVSTAADPEGRLTVVELVRSRHRLYPVGRLDIDSEGLVLLTDDGELTFRLTHARFGVEKEYEVYARCAELGSAELARLRQGVQLDDGIARAVRADLLRRWPEGVGLRVVLIEGRQRQVRRMLAAIDCEIDQLRRVRIGPLQLGDLEPGEYRSLRPREVAMLRQAVGLS